MVALPPIFNYQAVSLVERVKTNFFLAEIGRPTGMIIPSHFIHMLPATTTAATVTCIVLNRTFRLLEERALDRIDTRIVNHFSSVQLRLGLARQLDIVQAYKSTRV